jgi:hypothetical protein
MENIAAVIIGLFSAIVGGLLTAMGTRYQTYNQTVAQRRVDWIGQMTDRVSIMLSYAKILCKELNNENLQKYYQATAIGLYALLKTLDTSVEYETPSLSFLAYLGNIQMSRFYLENNTTLWAAWGKFAEEAKVIVGLNAEGKVYLGREDTT